MLVTLTTSHIKCFVVWIQRPSDNVFQACHNCIKVKIRFQNPCRRRVTISALSQKTHREIGHFLQHLMDDGSLFPRLYNFRQAFDRQLHGFHRFQDLLLRRFQLFNTKTSTASVNIKYVSYTTKTFRACPQEYLTLEMDRHRFESEADIAKHE